MDTKNENPVMNCTFCISCPFKKVKEPNDAILNINSLPKEILIKIFGYLKQTKLADIARVCRIWNECVRCPVLWKVVDRKVFGLHGSKNEAAKEIIGKLSTCVTHIKLDFGHMTDSLMFEDLSVTLQKRCHHLHTLIFCDTKLSVNLPSIINLCAHFLQNVRVLVIRNSQFGSCLTDEEYNDVCKLEVLDVRRCFPALGNKPTFSNMTYLKKLCLADVVHVDDSWFEHETSFLKQLEVLDLGNTLIGVRTFLALQTHAFHLTHLYLCRTAISNFDLMNFPFPQLKTVCLRLCHHVTHEGVISLIETCQSLQNIYVSDSVAECYAECDFAADNESKLSIVKSAYTDNHLILKDYLFD